MDTPIPQGSRSQRVGHPPNGHLRWPHLSARAVSTVGLSVKYCFWRHVIVDEHSARKRILNEAARYQIWVKPRSRWLCHTSTGLWPVPLWMDIPTLFLANLVFSDLSTFTVYNAVMTVLFVLRRFLFFLCSFSLRCRFTCARCLFTVLLVKKWTN